MKNNLYECQINGSLAVGTEKRKNYRKTQGNFSGLRMFCLNCDYRFFRHVHNSRLSNYTFKFVKCTDFYNAIKLFLKYCKETVHP